MKKRIVAAIIGMGIGQKHLDAIENYKNSVVKIICEKDLKKINFLKKKYPEKEITSNVNKIFENKNVNLVSIASYDDTHYEYILKSIKTGKNIIVEKPLCLTLKQLIDLNQKLRLNRKVKIISNLVLRVNDLFLKIKNSINKKKIFYVEADYLWGRKYKLYYWRSNIKNYSITLGAGIHMIDLIMWLLESRPISVMSYGSRKDTYGTNFKKNSLGIYIFKFPNDIIVKISANATGAFEHYHELKLFEKNKTYYSSFGGSYIFRSRNKKTFKTKLNSNYPDKKNRKKLIRNFIDHLLNPRKKCLMNLKDQVDLMTVCFYADKSLKTKKEQKIEYLQ